MTQFVAIECKLCYNLKNIYDDIQNRGLILESRYEYFMSEALDLPRGVWVPFASAGRQRSYAKNKILYAQGDAADCFYYIVSGRIKTFISSTAGNERLLTVYQKGDILGEAAFFDGQPRVSSAQLLTDAAVVAIDKPALERCLQQTPSLTFSLLKYLSGTVRMLSTHLDSTSFLPADKRIVRLLLNMDSESEHTIECTHEELGYALGISRVTVSRVLSALAKQGFVALGYRQITLLRPDRLKAYLSEG